MSLNAAAFSTGWHAAAPARGAAPADARLVQRVNALYHELTRDTFDATHRCRHAVERPFWEEVGRLALGGTSGARTVLDLACGTGFVSQVLRPYLSDRDRMLDLDLNTAALAQMAREHGDGGSRRICLAGSGESLPLADASVDLVAINAALHHFPGPVNALAEIDRVLKPGGHFALGFEPNEVHFASGLLPAAGAVLARAAWYASPRENRRRICQRLGLPTPSTEDRRVCAEINARLLRENLALHPLSEREILDLVDPHSRGDGELGFDPLDLMGRAFPSYEVVRLSSSDYLGEIPRRTPIFRLVVDRALGSLLPRHGSLFSWVLRKPTVEGAA